MNQNSIARVCHEVNRAYCQALGDNSQPTWEDAPEWQRSSARMGVDLHTMGDFGPEASHASWMKQKVEEGWVYGPVKDPELKQHPCMVKFAELPREQQAKDFIFRAIVHALRDMAPAKGRAAPTATSDDAIEQEIQSKGLTAPRGKAEDIEANIASEHYFTAEQGAFAAMSPPKGSDVVPPALSLLTFCVLVLRNGFTVTGESACASPQNFDADVGRKIARQNAVQKIWPLMGYELRTQLAKAGQ